MSEKPILFSGEMVRAILSGDKTQTRRVIRWPLFERLGRQIWSHRPSDSAMGDELVRGLARLCPYGGPGGLLWCREGFSYDRALRDANDRPIVFYRADGWGAGRQGGWKSSIHMPRWASRLILRITSVRVEQLQDISETDAKAEGVSPYVMGHGPISELELKAEPGYWSPRIYTHGFEHAWDRINGKRAPWPSNPWVWAIGFERVQ